MRRTITILTAIFALLLGALPTLADTNTAKTFRVYRTDGRVTGFFYNEIDSITTKADGDNLLQLFHTPDTVYAIPAAEIDSICYRQIPTVWQPGSIDLEGDISDYIIGCDSLTLFLYPSCPQNLIPRPGDNVAALNPLESLPRGFFGHVEKIVEIPDTIRVECSAPSLAEIFQSAAIEIEITDSDVDTIPEPQSRIGSITGDKTWDNVKIPDFGVALEVPFDVNFKDKFTGHFTGKGGVTLHTTLSHLNIATYIEKIEGKYFPSVQSRLTIIIDHSLEIWASVASGVNFEKKIPFVDIREQVADGLIQLYQEAGAYVEISGEIGLNGSLIIPWRETAHLETNFRSVSAMPNSLTITPLKIVPSVDLEGSASIGIGLYGKAGISPIAKELMGYEFRAKEGLEFSVSKSLLNLPHYNTAVTTVYDEINTDDFYRGDEKFELTDGFTFLNEEQDGPALKFSIKSGLPIWQKGVVPAFSNVSLVSDGSRSMTGTATLTRQLLTPVKVGLGLYDTDKKLVDSWWADDTYSNDNNGQTTISHTFEGLTPSTTYTLHPLVEVGLTKLAANPSSTAQTDDEGILVTFKPEYICSSTIIAKGFSNISHSDDYYNEGSYYFCITQGHLDAPDEEREYWLDLAFYNKYNGGEVSTSIQYLYPDTEYSYWLLYKGEDESIVRGNIEHFRTLPISSIAEQQNRQGLINFYNGITNKNPEDWENWGSNKSLCNWSHIYHGELSAGSTGSFWFMNDIPLASNPTYLAFYGQLQNCGGNPVLSMSNSGAWLDEVGFSGITFTGQNNMLPYLHGKNLKNVTFRNFSFLSKYMAYEWIVTDGAMNSISFINCDNIPMINGKSSKTGKNTRVVTMLIDNSHGRNSQHVLRGYSIGNLIIRNVEAYLIDGFFSDTDISNLIIETNDYPNFDLDFNNCTIDNIILKNLKIYGQRSTPSVSVNNQIKDITFENVVVVLSFDGWAYYVEVPFFKGKMPELSAYAEQILRDRWEQGIPF